MIGKQKKLRKKSLKPLPTLKAKAVKTFNKWIVTRDKRVCFTCGKPGDEAGHFKHGRLDFDEMNLHCQCTRCNRWLHGNLGEYAIRLIKKYGQEKVDDLVLRANQVRKYKRAELEEIITKYKVL
jgi:hypothetical protein